MTSTPTRSNAPPTGRGTNGGRIDLPTCLEAQTSHLLYAKVHVAGSNVAMCRDLAPIRDPEIEEERQHHVIIKPLHLTRAIYATAASL